MKKIVSLTGLFLLVAGMVACKNKKNTAAAADPFFPALSIIRGEVSQVDTSLFAIQKIDFADSARYDTSFIKREDFKGIAADFLTLPDLSQPEYRDRYQESSSYDTTLKRVILILEPKKPEQEVIQRQEVLIKPDEIEGDKVTSIHIDFLQASKDSLVEKRLFWQVNRSFQVATTRQLPGKPAVTTTYKVVWNEEQ